MRMIGHLDGEANARRFGDFLLVQGIENQIEADKGNSWAVWIHVEEELERARALLAEFVADPASPKFQGSSQAAKDVRAKQKKEQEAYERRLKDRRHLFRPLTAYGFGPLTFVLICASITVFVLSKFGADLDGMKALQVTVYHSNGRYIEWLPGLPEVRHGEIWRLLTPMFLHYTFLHIFFNMLWLRDLGSMIEARQGSLTMALVVVFFAAGSNFAQYYVSGPAFGGMSGVVYGLVGYIWIRGKFDPGSGLYLHPSTVTMMIIWFLVGLTGLLGVANTAHGSGLALGMAWGYLSSLRFRRRN